MNEKCTWLIFSGPNVCNFCRLMPKSKSLIVSMAAFEDSSSCCIGGATWVPLSCVHLEHDFRGSAPALLESAHRKKWLASEKTWRMRSEMKLRATSCKNAAKSLKKEANPWIKYVAFRGIVEFREQNENSGSPFVAFLSKVRLHLLFPMCWNADSLWYFSTSAYPIL